MTVFKGIIFGERVISCKCAAGWKRVRQNEGAVIVERVMSCDCVPARERVMCMVCVIGLE